MVVNEDMILEIVRPGTGDPVPDGEVGEIVVTTLDPHHPEIRLALGDLTAALPGFSPCGRTNRRIRGWLGRAYQVAKVRGMFVRPEQIAEIAQRHKSLGRPRLVVTRETENDAMTLHVERAAQVGSAGDVELADAVAATLQAITKLRGSVEVVAPGSRPNDGKVIADERLVG
jgi:phenylacetate-CoA ligase